jgi:hypothetical protein
MRNKKELIEQRLPRLAVFRWWVTFFASVLTIIKMIYDVIIK